MALAYGLACHAAFAAGVGAMIVGMHQGMTLGLGHFHGAGAVLANAVLLGQFALGHSLLLSGDGRKRLARLAPLGLGDALSTTNYALIASLQLVATFLLWSPLGPVWWSPDGTTLAVLTAVYAGAWLFLLKTMADAGLALQTGFLGWGAVVRGRRPAYRPFATGGSFRWVRQPVYVAFALTLWTAPVWTPDHLFLALVWTSYCVLAPRHKERRYLAAYGEDFERYRSTVPYWLPRRRPRH